VLLWTEPTVPGLDSNSFDEMEERMKKNCSICCMTALWTVASVVWSEMTGKEIVLEQEKRHKVQSETATDVMILIDRNNNKEKRVMKRLGKDFGQGERKLLMFFVEPADVKGTALLTWEHEKGADDQWLYLPAHKKMQRIAAGSKRSYVMGTDFTYEDLQPEDVDNYSYNVARSEKFKELEKSQEQDCWVIEAVPANEAQRKDSSYSKRLIWVRQDIYAPVKIEFYDLRGTLVKTQTIHDYENVKGDVWRAKKTLMDNHKEKHKTLVGVQAKQVDGDIDDKVFTERYVLSEEHIK
jgi:hypothetical protein